MLVKDLFEQFTPLKQFTKNYANIDIEWFQFKTKFVCFVVKNSDNIANVYFAIVENCDDTTRYKIENAIKSGSDLSVFDKSVSSDNISLVFKYVIKALEQNIKLRQYDTYRIVAANDELSKQYTKTWSNKKSILSIIFEKAGYENITNSNFPKVQIFKRIK